jgi:hypothetical protein
MWNRYRRNNWELCSGCLLDFIFETDTVWLYRFVHGTCDADADPTTYNRKKESNPDYEYTCPICKPRTQPGREILPKRKDSKYCSRKILLFNHMIFVMIGCALCYIL